MDTIIYYNGNFITINEASPHSEAMLIENGKIKAIGSNEDILNLQDNIDKIDLNGKTVLPGFIDGHGHIVAVAHSLLMPNLEVVDSIDSLISLLKEYIDKTPLKKGNWLIGMGYNDANFKEQRHPNKFDLDKVSTNIPIFLSHNSGHIATCNSKALKLLQYSGEDYTVPSGGVVRTLPNSNEAIGVLEENAHLSPEKKALIPSPTSKEVIESLVKAQNLYASYGITTAQDASIDEHNNSLLIDASKMNLLEIDIVGYAIQSTTTSLMENTGYPEREYHNHYKLQGGKTWLDGSIQGYTAHLLEPYYTIPDDKPEGYCGYETQSDNDVISYFETCIENSWQVNVHCNGDAAISQFITCYMAALNKVKNPRDLRPVMVHTQTVHENQLDEMKSLSIIPTFFLDHIWYFGDNHYKKYLGPERACEISPCKWALNREINFTLHQDSPVAMPNTLLSVHNAVNRKTKGGLTLGENLKIDVLDAIKAVTINAAYQVFDENIKGSLEVSKYADLVILDKNPLTCPHEEIKNIKILETIKEGKTIYKS